MNILVTGANGQLGISLRNATRKMDDRFIFTDVTRLPGRETVYLDITDIDAVRLICGSEKVGLIVNCAAYTAVDKAEDDVAMAELLNHRAVANLGKVAAETGATVIHISTDYVFRGDGSTPWREDWPASPLGVYGATKLKGEQALQAAGCPYLIFRTAWLYSHYGKNFVRTMLSLTAERPSLSVVFDQVGTPTYAADLAALIADVIARRQFDRTGIYHYTDEGVCSWYDFACAIRDLAGHSCEIRPCRTGEYPTKARRPAYSVLDKTLVKKTFGITIPHWYESLKRCIGEINRTNDRKKP